MLFCHSKAIRLILVILCYRWRLCLIQPMCRWGWAGVLVCCPPAAHLIQPTNPRPVPGRPNQPQRSPPHPARALFSQTKGSNM